MIRSPVQFMCLPQPQKPETSSLPPMVSGFLPQISLEGSVLNWFFCELLVLKIQYPIKYKTMMGSANRGEVQSGQSNRQWHCTENAKGMKTQSPNTSMCPNYSLMMSQVVNIFSSFQKQSNTQIPVAIWQAHIRPVISPCLSICSAKKDRFSTSQKIIATLYATNFMSKLPRRGFNYRPTQKSNPKDPWLWLSTCSPKKLIPNLPFRQRRVLTVSATMLTDDHRGQNYDASELTLNTLTEPSWGKTPPKSKTSKMVSMVSRKPLMVQVS